MLSKRPLPISEALAWNAATHRHLPECSHRMWAIAAFDDGRMVGVAIVGKPCRALDDGATLEVVRCASDGTKNVCSFLYGACAQAARAMGADLTTCIRDDEPGTTMRAAGWVLSNRIEARQWSCKSRPRKENELIAKTRWWAPHSRRLLAKGE